ncbi:MAG: pilin [Betaproteobacteria bacterium]|nr:MAG: pilin [Betaproteobacteria bacterium]TMG74293.1 MAG: pilin [Betaproteobacteria bacterium]
MRRTNNQAGFTILEVMGVIMIMGVLTALVLPTVRTNAVRAKMSEAIMAFGPCRNMITEVYLSGGSSPGAGLWGCEIDKDASQYVDSVLTEDGGKIRVTLQGFNDGRLNTKDLTLTPLDNTGTPMDGTGGFVRSWRCGSALDGTDVPPQYLPSSCRG